MATRRWFELVLLVLYASDIAAIESQRHCEPIRIDTCKDIGYNVTGMPNLVGHDLQQDAKLQLQTFRPLIQYGCSSRLKFFLCSVYVPMCTEKVNQPIGPCRTLCKSVKSRCQPVLQEFGFPWPSALACNNFPIENNDKHMCMEGPEPDENEREHHSNRNKESKPVLVRKANEVVKRHYGLCSKYRKSDSYYYVNRTGHCAHLCTADVLFSQEDKNFVEIWIIVWAGMCLLSTLFTTLTFLADQSSYKYPERAIVILSITYNIYSIGYIIRVALGRSAVACYKDSQHNVSLLTVDSLDNINCTVVFTLLYYFGMAGMAWWVILTLTWFFSEGLGKPHDLFQQYYTCFHLAAWLLPAVKTIIILVLKSVDADELTGVCFVGNQNHQALAWFVIIPSFLYLLVGTAFLIAGVVAIYKSKQKPNQNFSKVNKPKIRIGIFAVLYIVPAVCVLGGHIYVYCFREQWLTNSAPSRPNAEIFTLKIFMSLVMGITIGLWLWSSKSPLTTWNNFRKRLTVQKSNPSCQRYWIVQERSKRSRGKHGNETAV